MEKRAQRVLISEFETTEFELALGKVRFSNGQVTETLSFIIPAFVKLMNEIGAYGFQKHGKASFQSRADKGLTERTDRLASNMKHAKEHIEMYLNGDPHDKFGTLKHQLAAIAFNAMMEYYFLIQENPNERE